MSRIRTAALAATVWAAVSGLADPAAGQLAADRFAGLPAQPWNGLGRVRLSGMGGFLATVPDENQEINLFDFSSNPAGFGDDRDSWTIDMRYTYAKFVDGTASPAGNNVKVNDGTFALAYHQPRRFGLGGAIDYSEADAWDATRTEESYKIAGFSLIGSKYLFSKVAAGLSFGYSGEDQTVSSSEVYVIEHKATVPHAGMGVAYLPVDGVTLGIRGDAYPTTIDGTSTSSTHSDAFNWDRPAAAWSGHAFVDRGRLEAGADYTRRMVEGKESVRLGWSERFIWNPTPDNLTLETDTFSEDRTADEVRIRARLQVIPKRLSVSGSFANLDEEFTILSNPNAVGSLSKANADGSSTLWVAGAAYTMLRDRLLLAAEVEQVSREFHRVGAVDAYGRTRDDLNLRVGGEYLLGEKLAVRAGVVRGNSDVETQVATVPEMTYVKNEAGSGSFGSWRLATGLGYVPRGGIWQLDVAYDVTLDSAQDEDLSHFAAYVRYLF